MAPDDSALVRTLPMSFERALNRVPDALKQYGFGVLTRIDLKSALKDKIGVDIGQYVILGACNPTFAHKALSINPSIGVYLPCNITIRELSADQAEVRAVDPLLAIAAMDDQRLSELARQVRALLAGVIGSI